MNRRTPRLAAIAAGAALVAGTLAACSGNGGAAAGTKPSVSSGPPVQGGTITYAHVQEPPCIFGGWIQQAYISRQVLDGLVTENDQGTIEPWLATSWTVSPDGKKYVFALKPGVKFTDGTPVDAAAVAWNFDFWENHNGNATAKVSIDPYYKDAKALDATHVQIDLNDPFPEFLRLITQGYFGIQSPTAFKQEGTEKNCADPIGSGAFVVSQWKHGEEVVLKRNPNYTSWPATAKHKGPAYVNEVDWKFVPDSTSRYASLQTGQSQVVYQVPTTDWAQATKTYQTIRYITPGHPVSFYLNTQKGPFTDQRVRQAFAYGADRKDAVKAGFHGVIPYEPNPAVSQATPDYLGTDPYPYNPTKAGQLLDQAGWTKGANGVREKDGQPLSIKLVYGAGYEFTEEGAAVLQVLQQQWKQVGFDVKLVPATQAEAFSGKYSGPNAYDASPSYWTSPSPSILWIVWRPNTTANPNGNNQSFFNNDQLSQLIQSGNTSQDAAQAKQYYQQAQQLINTEAAGVGLYTQNSLYAVSDKLHDFWLEKSQGEPVFSDAYYTK